MHLVFSFHTHSSVAQMPKEAIAFQQRVEKESENKDQDVVFKIIWKNSKPCLCFLARHCIYSSHVPPFQAIQTPR